MVAEQSWSQHGCQRQLLGLAALGVLGELCPEVDDLELGQVNLSCFFRRLPRFDFDHSIFECIFFFFLVFNRQSMWCRLGLKFLFLVLEGRIGFERTLQLPLSCCLCFLVSIIYDYWATIFILLIYLFLQINFPLILYTEMSSITIDFLLNFVISNH